MTNRIIVAGTDTDIGKTVFSAGFVAAIDGYYWKPVQAGLEGETDAQSVARLSCVDAGRIMPEVYRLTSPASPHLAAERDGITIEPHCFVPPATPRPLIIELAGGLMVPITRQLLQIDMIKTWSAPVILCASTRLGTINHTLLSIEALKRRAIALTGIAFIGGENIDTQRTIAEFGGVTILGRLPMLDHLDRASLRDAFASNFDVGACLGLKACGP